MGTQVPKMGKQDAKMGEQDPKMGLHIPKGKEYGRSGPESFGREEPAKSGEHLPLRLPFLSLTSSQKSQHTGAAMKV
jgi:hypothetical protein